MTLIERIAARFGFVRERPLPLELIVFRNRSEAIGAGFRGAMHSDPDFEHVRAWWPGQGMRELAGRPIRRVTVTERMSATNTDEGRLFDILRARQMVFGDKAMWVELG